LHSHSKSQFTHGSDLAFPATAQIADALPLADVLEEVTPAVVNIAVTSGSPAENNPPNSSERSETRKQRSRALLRGSARFFQEQENHMLPPAHQQVIRGRRG
jgi:hypothetical protein